MKYLSLDGLKIACWARIASALVLGEITVTEREPLNNQHYKLLFLWLFQSVSAPVCWGGAFLYWFGFDLMMMMSWCLMSSDVIWHIRDKLWPMPKFNKSHIRKVYACLAVTCHLHFWQNDRDFLRATVVTRGWNGYRNKSQHRKSTLENKILPAVPAGIRTRDLSITSPAL